ncbi:MAG: TolC family protein [Terriglobales bacterium]
MRRSTGLTVSQRAAAIFLAATMIPAGWAQEASTVPSAPSQQAVPSKSQPFDVKEYAKPRSHFPDPIGPYTSRHTEPPNLANTPRIDQLLHDGKLYISMNDAVALALENNLDIAIARYNLNIADTEVWRAKAGAAILGISTGIVQNTPGGSVGGLGGQVGSGQGGTSVGAGGAGAGVGGLVGSTFGLGPVITSFDPVLTGTLQLDRQEINCTSPFCGSTQNTSTANFAYTQGFQWGSNLSVAFNNSRVSSNNEFNELSPLLSSSFRAQVSQHLMQGFGFAPNTRYIQIAKNNRKLSDVAFRLQTITTVDQIENMYWDLVYAYENVKVQQENLAFAQKTLSDTKKQVEIGTLAPIEVVRAQSNVASDQQTLTLALTNLQRQQLLMKNALSRTLVDPTLADAEVIPTSTMEVPAEEPVRPTEELVNNALSHRPDLAEARINLTNTDISNKAIRNALLPSLDAFAYYSGSGVGGVQNPGYICETEVAFCNPVPNPPPYVPVPSIGYGGTLNQLINSTAPDKGVGLQLTIPIRNRAAQATQVRSEFEYRQAQLHIQQIENQVRIEVRNAQFGVQENRASVASAQAAVDLARQSLDAEQKKYALGASTSTLVLQNQTALTQAQVTLVSAKAYYEKAQVELDRATGLLLEHANIEIADAERGQVTREVNIPHVAARPADQQNPASAPAQPPQ